MIEERRLIKELEIAEGVAADVSGNLITVKGPLGELKREIKEPSIKVEIKDKKIFVKPNKFTKKQKMQINTLTAHLNNMMKGVREEFVYKLKICSGHFPMNVNVENDKVVVKNFFGEKIPRTAKIMSGVKVEIKGDEVTVSGISIEDVGQTSTNIEQATKITNRDRRVFQDGIWLVEKAGKQVRE